MNNRSQLRRKARGEPAERRSRLAVLDRESPFPAPDPSTRVAFGHVSSSPAQRQHGGELVVAVGLGAILVSVSSKFAQLIELPSLSEVSVAALGGALAALGVLKHRLAGVSTGEQREADEDIAPAPVEDDLPSLTGQLSAVLAELRQQHGVVYRSRTWIEVVLPAAGFTPPDPALARDLLAAAALDAGGVRADVAKLSETHTRDEIVAASTALINAVQSVLARCAPSNDSPHPPRSDPSCWPASAC